ncbi:serine/threonine-protein phosphatase 6 regulatory ankyrin repeat subunit C-like [Penaeus monodon]|uniref:serine/threonine-protein phosphatase 6 regulatory ankyrin repeat subunit C-like n=1 Tax=Penaeus monodon TaxID=6687 RepID=UPI0018A73B99|nr:serine/threonine-protein phosphatase 6 regulatory ankyrin repeat subunit C-like [Penaeus monodon]
MEGTTRERNHITKSCREAIALERQLRFSSSEQGGIDRTGYSSVHENHKLESSSDELDNNAEDYPEAINSESALSFNASVQVVSKMIEINVSNVNHKVESSPCPENNTSKSISYHSPDKITSNSALPLNTSIQDVNPLVQNVSSKTDMNAIHINDKQETSKSKSSKNAPSCPENTGMNVSPPDRPLEHDGVERTDNNAIYINNKVELTDGIASKNAISHLIKDTGKTALPTSPFGQDSTEKTENNDVHVNHKVEAADCKASKNVMPCPENDTGKAILPISPLGQDGTEETENNAIHLNNKESADGIASKNVLSCPNTGKAVSPISPLGQEGTERKEQNAVHINNKVESADCKAGKTTLPCTEKNTENVASSISPLVQYDVDRTGNDAVERTGNDAVHDASKGNGNALPCQEKKTGQLMNNHFERADNVNVNHEEQSASGEQNGIPPVSPEKKNEENVYSYNSQLVQNVIEKTENRGSVLDSKNMEDIHIAARNGDADGVLKMLEKGEDPSAFTSANNTPLHYAAYEGHTEVVKLLLDRKADPNILNNTGDTPLHLVAINGKTEVVKILCECEYLDVNNPSATNETLLAYARHGGEKPMLNVLKNPETISPEGNTPLHCASLAGHTDVVRLLLMKNADAKGATPTQHTPLHYAALRGDAILVKLLVSHGADPNAKDERNNTPLHYAALSGHTPVVELLVDERADTNILTDMGLSVLHKASFYGRLSTVQKLVELQVTLTSMRDKKTLSAEDTAVIRGHVHIAWWLNKIARHASLQSHKHLKNICVNLYTQSGDFYHTYCREKNASAEALATAITFGVCDMHYQDEQGRTLLHVAAEQNDPLKIRVLLERGALPTARTHDGKTPSDLAREKGHLEAARTIADTIKVEEKECERNRLYARLLHLITRVAKVNLQGDNEEQAALLAAVKEASSLLASGAPLEPPEGHSCHALHLAIATNCTPLLTLLLAVGAPMTSSADGFGPVQLAWNTPDVTTWVGVVVTRAVIHKILMEMTLLDPNLQLSAETLVKSLEREKPWDARVIISENSSITLDSFLFQACASGATTFAWWIWHSGGSAVSQNKDKRTPLHAALASRHLDTAINLVLHMGANLFLPDNKGQTPLDLIPVDVTRRQVLKASFLKECRRLADESEKARDPRQKQEAKEFVLLLLSLYCAISSQEDTDSYCDTVYWKTVFGYLNDESSESDDWIAKLVYGIRNQDMKDNEDGGSERRFSDVTCDKFLELIAERRANYYVSNVQINNTEKDIPVNIIEKATIFCCEKDFPLFLHLLVHVGGQQVNQELEVCRASPLHYAALKNNASAARYLVSHGASIEAKDRFGNTPAHYACMYGHRDLGDFLRTDQVNRCGLTAMDLLDGYKNYLKQYELDPESLVDIDMQKTNTGPQRIEAHLNELKKKWQVSGIAKAIAKVHVKYSRGEPEVIKKTVLALVESVQNSVAKKNALFSGEPEILGSSADNVRLFCPDEFDCNIVLNNLHGYANGGLQISLQEMELSHNGCKTKINVSSNNKDIIHLLQGNNFLHTFYNLVKECITNFEPEDKRIAIIPPGVKKTQVGVGLSLAWMGNEFPLLLVDVDIVPTMEAPWPADLPRPPLTPPHLKSVYINSIGNGEWRFSFAKAENEIMKTLTPEQRQVFLACKMVLSSLKAEKWAPREIQNRFKYFDKIFFKIPSPKGFVLKNTFFLEMQEFKDHSHYWTHHFDEMIRRIFKRMCIKDTKEPAKIEAYFAGSTEASCLGYGASEIVAFFTPKPGFHGVSAY